MLTLTANGFDLVTSALDGMGTGVARAAMRGLNRAIGSARTVETKAIATDTGLKQSDVRDALPMKTATTNDLTARLTASIKRIPISDFKAYGPYPSRGKGPGVTYKLVGGKGIAPHAFLATLKSGHVGVFERLGKARLPIRELRGPSLGHVFIKYQPDAIARAQEIFVTNFDHEMEGAWGGTPVPSDPAIPTADV